MLAHGDDSQTLTGVCKSDRAGEHPVGDLGERGRHLGQPVQPDEITCCDLE